MSIDYRKLLNDEQYRVVTEGDGPCLVLAGAGSGKTRTLVYRVAFLLEKGIKPENILLVTFTNKAAKEMLARVETLNGNGFSGLWGGTFHHIGNFILRHHAHRIGYKRNFNILDQEDSTSLVKRLMQAEGLAINGLTFPKPSVVQSVISFSRNTNCEVVQSAQDTYGYPENVAIIMGRLAKSYEEKKLSANVMDFDDLLLNWLRLLEECPDVKEKYAKQFQYVLVDEYQDTNYVQAKIIEKLSDFHHNVLVVGDDSQSIYSFRAADVRNILDFPKLFSNAKIYKIETNYRSTPQILSLANDSIKHNLGQFEKNLKAVRDGGTLPVLLAARDEHQEAMLVVKRIAELTARGLDYSSIAVLFRSTYQSAELQLEMSKSGYPYVVRGGLRYFERAHIKDVIAYLKILANHRDELSWRRILLLYEGIGPKGADKMWQKIQGFESLAELMAGELVFAGKAGISWQKLVTVFRKMLKINLTNKGSLADAVQIVLAEGYEQHLKNIHEDYRDRLDDLQQLQNFLGLYNDLEKLLADVMLSEAFADSHENDRRTVVLTTIHQAKGLEWPVVFIIGLRDGYFPNNRNLEKANELEEERRLFYVAVTRAKDELNMLYPIRSFSYKFGEVYSNPSMFIKEVDASRYLTKEGSWGGKTFNKPWEEDDGEEVIYYND